MYISVGKLRLANENKEREGLRGIPEILILSKPNKNWFGPTINIRFHVCLVVLHLGVNYTDLSHDDIRHSIF